MTITVTLTITIAVTVTVTVIPPITLTLGLTLTLPAGCRSHGAALSPGRGACHGLAVRFGAALAFATVARSALVVRSHVRAGLRVMVHSSAGGSCLSGAGARAVRRSAIGPRGHGLGKL